MLVPRIETSHLILEQISVDDADGVFRFASHDQVAQTSTWEIHSSVDDSRAYISCVLKKISLERGKVFLCWIVKTRADQKIIGLVSLTELGLIRAQVWYVFHYDHWNRSEPMEAVKAVLNFGYQRFSYLYRMQARCFPTNTASRGLLEGLGFQFEGINHGLIAVRGLPVDLTSYATTRDRWKQLCLQPFQNESGGHI